MSNILRALEIAKEVGKCYYRPFNGDIIVSPKDDIREILHIHVENWSEKDAKDFYFNYSQDFVRHAWMGIEIDSKGGLTLSLGWEEDSYDREMRLADDIMKLIREWMK